jgi:hypothetical protein
MVLFSGAEVIGEFATLRHAGLIVALQVKSRKLEL